MHSCHVAPVVRRGGAARLVVAVARPQHLQWGLSARLPIWRAFDGRRSMVSFSGAASAPDVLSRLGA